MSWPNSLRVITLCLRKTLPALSTGTCRAFLLIRHRISSLFWEKHNQPEQLLMARAARQLRRATCHITGLQPISDELGLAMLFPEVLKAFWRPPTQVPSQPNPV